MEHERSNPQDWREWRRMSAWELSQRGWTQADLAEFMGRPLRSINEIINCKKGITAETAIGLGKAFGTSAEYWLNLESAYRLHIARRQGRKTLRRARS